MVQNEFKTGKGFIYNLFFNLSFIQIMIKKVVLGISGGVDSALAAVLLKKRGFDVQAVFMRNWDIADETGTCRADEDFKDAAYVCKKLNIKLHHVNFVKEYWNEVFCDLIKEYESGNTPNPDILCNRNIKFNYFYKYAMKNLEADAIATGHYARTTFGTYLEKYNPNKGVKLLRAKDTKKDQTFFLCQVPQEALQKTIFPLGDLFKSDVKLIAAKNGFEKIAEKPESMGICFIGSRNFQKFIEQYIEDRPGKLIDIETGQIVGEHKGFHQWTLGQRLRLSNLSEAYFICRKSVQENIIYVAQGTAHSALYSTLFSTNSPYWIHSEPKELIENNILLCKFKFQHTETLDFCKVCKLNNGLVVQLDKPKRALTNGQYAVFYRDEECLGSATILNTGASNFSLLYLENHNLNLENKSKDALNRFSKS